MEYRSSSATASRNGFAGKCAYDGVFASPARSAAAKLTDYGEVFGGDGSRGSSIPVLDVPELRERKVSVDVRRLKLDYADIFGGSGDSDYAVSFEELIVNPRNGPEVARTPEYTRSSPEVSNPCNKVSTNEVPCQSFGEVKQFNVMYQKNNVASKNGATGTKHIAQLHAVSGYTRLIDESSPLRKAQDDRPVTPVGTGSDTCSKMHRVDGTIEGKCFQKSMPDLPPNGTNKQTSQGSVKIQRKSMQNKSFSNDFSFDGNDFSFDGNDFSFDGNDFGFGTYSQQVQPPSSLSSNAVNNNERESKGPVVSNFEGSTFDATDAGASSPPYFGEEVDKNSVAATSAAAVKLAIEKAQARIRFAKELKERKKEGLESREGLRAQKKRREKVAVKENILEEEKKKVQKVLNTPIELSDWANKRDDVKVGQVTPCCGDMKDLRTTKEAVEGMRRKEIKTVQADDMLGEKKEREPGEQLCELVRAVKHSAMALEVKQTDEVNGNFSSANGSEQEEIGMVNSAHEKPVDNNMKCKVVEEVLEWEDGVIKLNTCEGEHELEAHAAMLMAAHKNYDQEGEQKLEVVQEHEETEKEVCAPHEQDECYEKQKETTESVGVLENVEAQELEENRRLRLEEDHERVENGKKLGEAEDQEEHTNGSANNHETVTRARKLEDIHGKEDNGKKLDESSGSEENEMESEEPCKWKENENQQKDAESEENMEKSGDGIHKQEMIGDVFNNFKERDESEEYFEDSKSEETEQLEGEEKELNETCQVEEDKTGTEETFETGQEETCEWTDTADIWTEIDQRKKEETAEAAHEALKYNVNNLEATDDMFRHNENEHLSKTKETCKLKEIGKDVETASEATLYGGRIIEGATPFEAVNSEKGSESSAEGATDLDYKELFDINGVPDGALELDEMIKQMKDESDAFLFNANRVHLGKAEIKSGKKQIDQYAEESVIISNVEKHCNGLVHELGEKSKSIKEAELSIGNEEDRYNFKETCEERWVHNREAEAAQQPSTSGGRVETRKKESNQRGVEREHIKKLDEAKEREKEKEKERIAVQRAIREARERAFAGARERATMEKLTAGARRKPVTEARERPGKASAEANYQPSADKEAKRKAERAAVERATAEARERALEKAKSGKAASDARNQSEKLSGGSRDDGMGQTFPSSETQNRAPGPSNSCRYSNHGVPTSTERSEGSNNEMAQRFKGERERQQRTAERAAKALAEKNTRDLLAQKEQAERNRLAEALDADIKRWSSRKEGNLRALLSTLHYILGPDSGWQAVPLTDIIATAAVKKMYKRATLFVHPDKLQQRGATIQHKYMCEKVFDILKEAWEKFNREER